jgi:hypothetical protein
MSDPTIKCPKCNAEFPLTDSLAAPLLEASRKNFEQQLVEQSAAIAADADKRIRAALADDIAKANEEKTAAQQLLKDRDTKLAEARKNELELRQERQKLQEEKEQFELEKQRAIDAERAKIRESAQKDADEKSRLKIAEKEKTINDLQIKLQDALRKAEQGSQQLQGEVLELQLEEILRQAFPLDNIIPVPKGEYGGDILHQVCDKLAQPCGTILWESKRTRNWSDGWLAKLRENQRAAGAEIAIIVSEALPNSVSTFDLMDGVWVSSPKCATAVAIALRYALLELAAARNSVSGQQSKMELVYEYLTGSKFRHRIEAIVEKFDDMRSDLEKERKSMTKQWAKREEQIRCVVDSVAGMFGDLQGIAGKAILEIEGLESGSPSITQASALPSTDDPQS